MQEEVEQRVVTLAINCTKLTEQELKKALVKLLQHWKMHQQKGPHGKMTVKQLAAQNRGLQSVEVTDQNIGSFKKIARKYGIDFAPYKAKGQDRYLVFFKAQDADAMTAAFKEYTAKTVKQHSRPSVLAKLAQFKELMQSMGVKREKKRSWNVEKEKLEKDSDFQYSIPFYCPVCDEARTGCSDGPRNRFQWESIAHDGGCPGCLCVPHAQLSPD